ncbi:pilus assembly secretion protein [Cupriavidus taiwanensis]|uniref:Pilus assembly secretion protein n=1 Tax=Cupriavidus taiwanensis TaxID=164546 RepID=A0A375E8A8_9BURK|nr:type II and III secretion system protein family protein [Cupriavidus taiwanensis]SOZ61138.1 pilus assembly secretion protein [Cupriavidus taiwanensis]SOZ61235.1 pilus assembly secretion protein [Cupriavidus taiwanensis]SOZ65409.1 pilus assembly secretion protein [Cupriavidus taiwanensis]SOZ99977.1 pilus assembly secretion protein [Cupriavidus taiwanensis]SPA06940.1 pilus assembly secretion protein [Cupriavidus taiwanensis]
MNQTRSDAAGSTRILVLAAILCTPLAAAAQAAVEAGNLTKATAPAAAKAPQGPMQMTISMTPGAAAPAAQAPAATSAEARGPNCTGAIRSESSVVVPVGKSQLITLQEPVRNRTLGNPNVVQATMVSPQTLYVLGRTVGTTNMIVQGRSGSCSIINVVVNADAGGLQTSLGQLLPGEPGIRVTTAADNLVLTGSVTNAQAAQQAMEIAQAYANAAQGGDGNKKGSVLNMLSVDTPQQVMLEVKVAEVSKTLLNQLGSAVNLQGGFGSWSGGLVTSLLTGASAAVFGSKANNRPFEFALDAQKNDSLVKILAEPNLVTISGQEASFLAGGKIYIPVAQANVLNGAGTVTLQEEEFGVGLKFTPTVLANGRIHLKVAPEVSELSPTGATIRGGTLAGQTILPVITTRRASTTVQMRDGESFAIGGLLTDSARGSLKALPGAGEVPVLGTLFRSTQYQQDLSELVFIITPRLVKPMQTSNYPLPTDSFSTPNPLSLYFMGNMEGDGKRPTQPAPAPSQPAAPAAAPAAPPAAPRSEGAPTTTVSAVPTGRPLDEPAPAASPAAAAPGPRPSLPAPAAPARSSAVAPAPAEDTAARIARIEATAARLAQARAAASAGRTASGGN